MQTGLVSNWIDVDMLGPIYPFVGTEVLLSVVGIASWIAWHIVQIQKENSEFAEDLKNIQKKGGIDKLVSEEAGTAMQD